MRKEKKLWEQHKLDDSQNDPGTLWKNVKSWLSCGNSDPPTKKISSWSHDNKPSQAGMDHEQLLHHQGRTTQAEDPHHRLRPT